MNHSKKKKKKGKKKKRHLTGGDAIDLDMDAGEGVSAFKSIKDSEISDSADGSRIGGSYANFEEEKVPNISKTRVGEFDRSSIGNLESQFD